MKPRDSSPTRCRSSSLSGTTTSKPWRPNRSWIQDPFRIVGSVPNRPTFFPLGSTSYGQKNIPTEGMTTEVGGNPWQNCWCFHVLNIFRCHFCFIRVSFLALQTRRFGPHSLQYEGLAALESAFAGGCSKYEQYWSRSQSSQPPPSQVCELLWPNTPGFWTLHHPISLIHFLHFLCLAKQESFSHLESCNDLKFCTTALFPNACPGHLLCHWPSNISHTHHLGAVSCPRKIQWFLCPKVSEKPLPLWHFIRSSAFSPTFFLYYNRKQHEPNLDMRMTSSHKTKQKNWFKFISVT